ncbi:hypothetical protein [Rhizobium sp. LjRoot258]|uniref:hypothetical protein n=1 Tax=Rhizobium sp. LjRoot258 TaxID=3342299 RepID=UPI003ECD8AFD
MDHEPRAFYLLEENGALYLDAFCSHSCFDYGVLIALNDDESAEYAAKGRPYLERLAYDIHYSAPAAKESTSLFKSRNLGVLSRETSEKVSAAIVVWRSANGVLTAIKRRRLTPVGPEAT